MSDPGGRAHGPANIQGPTLFMQHLDSPLRSFTRTPSVQR